MSGIRIIALATAAVMPAALQAQDAAPPPPAAAAGIDAAINPGAIELGREIVALGYPEASREAMFGGVIDTIVAQMNQANEAQLAQAEPEIRSFIMDRQGAMIVELKGILARHIPSMMEGLAEAYASEFSAAELAEIRNFVATPAGQAFIERSMQLVGNQHYVAATQPFLNEVASETQRWQQDMIAELREKMEGEAAAE